MRKRHWLIGALILLLPTPACTNTTDPRPSTSLSAGTIAADLHGLLTTIKARHPDPWHGVDEPSFTAALRQLQQAAPRLDADQRLVEVARLMALLGTHGREGHTGIFPWVDAPGTHMYPIQLWQFPDGLYVVAAQAAYANLVGGRVITLAGHSIAEITAAIRPLVPRDSDQTIKLFGPLFHLQPEVLHGLRLSDGGPAPITVAKPDGATVSATLTAITSAAYLDWANWSAADLPPVGGPPPAYLRDRDKNFMLTWLAPSRTAYLRYHSILGSTVGLADELTAMVRDRKAERIVIDLRTNGGGDNHTYAPLLTALGRPELDRAGHLYVLISRVTFSAAANFATELDQHTTAIFVGEATGGSPNLYGDTITFPLPSLGLAVRIPKIYWQKSTPDDPRLAIEPDLPVPLTAADFFAGHDPVLAAVQN